MNVNAIRMQTNTQAATATSSAGGSNFSSYLNTDATLDTYFTKASQTYGVPKALLEAITMQESSFNPKATSHCGAQGLMQLMPATARSLGVTDAYDPEQNIMGGAKYISQLLAQYNGNTEFALAAYNAGSNNVSKYGGIPPFKETQDYVVKVMGYYRQGVDVPSTTFSSSSSGTLLDPSLFATGDTEDTSASSELLDQIFSYDDYIRFLNLFTLQDEKEQSKEKNENEQSAGISALQQMQYNNNLLNQIKNYSV